MMNFTCFWTSISKAERAILVAATKKDCGSANALYIIARGERMAGVHTIARLMKADKRITFRMMRPDLFGSNDD